MYIEPMDINLYETSPVDRQVGAEGWANAPTACGAEPSSHGANALTAYAYGEEPDVMKEADPVETGQKYEKYEKCKLLYDIYESIKAKDSEFYLYLSSLDKSSYIIILYKLASTPLFDIIKSLFSISRGYTPPHKFIINILLVFSTEKNIILVYKKLIEDIRIVSKEDYSYFEILLQSKNELNKILLSLSQDSYQKNTIHTMPVSKILTLLKQFY